MTTTFKLVFEPGPAHVRARVFVGPEGGTLALAGQLAFRVDEWRQFHGALEIGCAFHEASPRFESEPAREPRLGRCSLCGAQRIAKRDGTWGACTLITCADPLFDMRREEAGHVAVREPS